MAVERENGGGFNLLTAADVARRLAVSTKTLRRVLIKTPSIRPVVVGRSLRFTEQDFAALVEALRRPPIQVASVGRTYRTTRIRMGGKTPQEEAVELMRKLRNRLR